MFIFRLINSNVNHSSSKLKKLTAALSGFIDDYMLVSFVMLDNTDESSIELVMAHTDHCLQYGEDAEPREIKDETETDVDYDFSNHEGG